MLQREGAEQTEPIAWVPFVNASASVMPKALLSKLSKTRLPPLLLQGTQNVLRGGRLSRPDIGRNGFVGLFRPG
jgi:hypothetical protein